MEPIGFERILVTGATGFIGHHLVSALRAKYPYSKIVGVSRSSRVYPFEIDCQQYSKHYNYAFFEPYQLVNCDLTQEGLVASLMLRFQPDVVFHLGAVSTIKPNENDRCLVTRTNVLSTHHLLAYAKPGCRFVLASSAAVYGNLSHANEDEGTYPTSAYGASKVAAEALVRAYHNMGLVSGLAIRYAATVGGGATHGLLKDIIAKLKSSSVHLDLLGDFPGSIKPFTHVDDVVCGTLHLAEKKVNGVVNLANNDSISVNDVAYEVMSQLGITKEIRYLGACANWVGDNPKVSVDSNEAIRLGWKRKYPNSLQAIRQAVIDMEASK